MYFRYAKTPILTKNRLYVTKNRKNSQLQVGIVESVIMPINNEKQNRVFTQVIIMMENSTNFNNKGHFG